MTATERKRRQRALAKAAGLCIDCCRDPALPGRTKCKPCNDAAKTYVKASRP